MATKQVNNSRKAGLLVKFGLDTTYEYIKNNIGAQDNSKWYDYLYKIIENDALSVLSEYKLQKADKDDIIQNAQLSVTRYLVSFVLKSSEYSVYQRNAWLRKIIKSRINDFFREKSRQYLQPVDEAAKALIIQPASANFTDLADEQAYFEEQLIGAIERVCSINTTPEKIIAFLLNRVSGSIELSRKNGSPKDVAKMINGKAIDEAFQILKMKLCCILSVSVPDSALYELIKKIDDDTSGSRVGSFIISITPRSIADSSYWISRKLNKEIREDIKQL
ncbi:MAG TPA: hypothetical protein DIW17_06925 [Clostridiales bacterium]|nr:hypothetical protein [Clostridia bacterium]HCS73589.1 hypothetical protein [Clostridiales bacterium]